MAKYFLCSASPRTVERRNTHEFVTVLTLINCYKKKKINSTEHIYYYNTNLNA